MNLPILTVALENERDVVTARKRARQVADQLGFDAQDATRISTAVSEVARNAFMYGGGGSVAFELEPNDPKRLVVRVADQGRGIADLKLVLSGRYQSTTGMGLGLIGTRRLMDAFDVQTAQGQGTTVTIAKNLPRGAQVLGPSAVAELTTRVTQAPQSFYDEIRVQNQELVKLLAELREKQDDLARVNRELEETNRGVMALYAELDDRAERLREADQMKSRFLSYVSHEFRTPLNGIIGLTRLLLGRGERDEEELKQIKFIQRSAEELTEMVNDLLDLAKAEAGKLTVQPSAFALTELFGALRGMFRPLTNESVRLTLVEPEAPLLFTDESKVAQILRNFVSNALKFTEAGEVLVSGEYDAKRDLLTLSVRDTGIGIAPENQAKIFEEFTQLDSLLQRKVKGTGLGLPLCKKLVELLGGHVRLESEVGKGSTFSAVLPRRFGETAEGAALPDALAAQLQKPAWRKALLIDDEDVPRYLLRQSLKGLEEIIEATSGEEGLRRIEADQPDIVFLDLTMPGMSGFEVLDALELRADGWQVPVVVVTAQVLSEEEQKRLRKGALAILSKDVLARAGQVRVEFGPPVSVVSEPAAH